MTPADLAPIAKVFAVAGLIAFLTMAFASAREIIKITIESYKGKR